MSIVVRQISEEDSQRWDQFVTSHPSSKIYHLSSWKTLISKVFGHDCPYLIAEDEERRVCGVLPLVRLKSYLFGDYLVSVPYFNYGGALSEDAAVSSMLMHSAAELAEEVGASHVEFRDYTEGTEAWPEKTSKISMILPLPASEEQLWNDLGSKRRAQIKRPLRENPEILIGKENLVGDFYRVFSENMRDLGTPVYSKRFFSEIISAFSDACTIIVIRLRGKPVGAAFLVSYKGAMEIPWASTVKRVNNLGINMLMYWEALKYSIDKKHTYFDFGRSTVDSGTYRFKRQWGAEKFQLYWRYHLVKGDELPALNPDNPRYQLAINMWKRLPLKIANLLGPCLVKNLP